MVIVMKGIVVAALVLALSAGIRRVAALWRKPRAKPAVVVGGRGQRQWNWGPVTPPVRLHGSLERTAK
jgi:hypothetical protein